MDRDEQELEDYTVYGNIIHWTTVRAHDKKEAMAIALAEGEWEVCAVDDPTPSPADIIRANRCEGSLGDIVEEDPARDACAELLSREVFVKLRGDAEALGFDLFEALSVLIESLENTRGRLLTDQQG